GGSCNALVAAGNVHPTDELTTPPEMTGGPLIDGTYALTGIKIFHDPNTGPFGGGPPQGELYQIAGTSLQTAYIINGGGPEGAESQATFDSLATADNHISASAVCGSEDPLDATYTSDGIQLQILWPEDEYGNTWLREFERQ